MDEHKLYKIEKGVPIPGGQSRWTMLANRMEVGDSVVVKNGSQVSGLLGAFSRKGFKGVSRCLAPVTDPPMPQKERYKQPHRVWKVEPKHGKTRDQS